jgi:Arc/MetJ-type ribon-helix-helix transcriptional regulator
MKIATINIPDEYLNCIEILVNLGYYPSRSECVREALKQFLGREVQLNENLKAENFERVKSAQMQKMMH